MKNCGLLVCLCLLIMAGTGKAFGQAPHTPNLQDFVGWWIGQGRLGFRDGQSETIKCRATYRRAKASNGLRQTIRCATRSGTVEIVSTIRVSGRARKGTWKERKYELSGELEGNAVPGGFRVKVLGGELNANMTVVLRGGKQVVEVQFLDGQLLGLTVLLTRGSA